MEKGRDKINDNKFEMQKNKKSTPITKLEEQEKQPKRYPEHENEQTNQKQLLLPEIAIT